MAEVEDDVEVGETREEFHLNYFLVLWKSAISVSLSALSVWVILSSLDVFDNFAATCDQDANLCAFKAASFAFSVVLNIPLVVESFNMNKVFFVWILQGNFFSEQGKATAKKYIERAGKMGLINYDPEEFNLQGREILTRVVYNVTRPRPFCYKVFSVIRTFFATFLLIPLLFVWRLVLRSLQCLFTFPWLITDAEYRADMKRTFTGIFIAPLLMLADPLCVFLLFPLSFVIIFSASSVGEVFLNLVAVQVFAQIDDDFVNNFFHPQNALIDRASIYYRGGHLVREGSFTELHV